jgi:radical SAM superfamily enzyme YgiQ (UPF0313 family)
MAEITWESWNKETYERVGKEPLSNQYRRTFKNEYRFAIISLFSVENIGTRLLYAFLKEAGYDVDLIFLKGHAVNNWKMPSDKEIQLLIDLLKERNIKVAGLALRSSYLKFGCDLTKRIHDDLDIPVIWGGTAPTVTPELCIKGGADYAINNEGEEAISELLTAMATGQDTTHIENLWYKGEDGEPVGNPNRPLLVDLDVLPVQNLEDDDKFFIEKDTLTPGDPWRDIARFETLTARGCPYVCSFCIHSYLKDLNKGLGKAVNGCSVEHVIREIEYAKAKLPKMTCIFFCDEVFGTGMQWTRDFVPLYKERVGLPFDVAIEPRALNDEKVELLKDAGLHELNMGIQSGSEKVRRELYDRPMTDKKLFAIAALMKKHNIFTRYDIIVDSPFESREDKRKTLDILLQLPRPFILNMFSLNYFPAAKLTEKALELGYITDDQVEGSTEKCLRQFSVSFDYPRSKEDMMWNALYAMSSKWFIPRPLLRLAANWDWFKRHPKPLVVTARLSSMIRLFAHGTSLLIRGRITFADVYRYAGSVGSIIR